MFAGAGGLAVRGERGHRRIVGAVTTGVLGDGPQRLRHIHIGLQQDARGVQAPVAHQPLGHLRVGGQVHGPGRIPGAEALHQRIDLTKVHIAAVVEVRLLVQLLVHREHRHAQAFTDADHRQCQRQMPRL